MGRARANFGDDGIPRSDTLVLRCAQLCYTSCMGVRRNAAHLLVCALLVGAIACKTKTQPADKPAITAATQGSAGSGSADPWAKSGPANSANNETKASAPPPLATDKKLVAAPLFWTATKNGKTLHLLGTIHLGIDAEKQLPTLVWDVFKAAPRFAMETDMSDPSMLAAGIRKDGSALSKELGAPYWDKLEKAVGGDTAKMLDRMTAATAATMLAIRGLPMTSPMDLVLFNAAKDGKKAVVYLEPPSKQLALLDKWLGLKQLQEMLDDLGHVEVRNRELLAAYESGSVEKIAQAEANGKADFLKLGHPLQEYETMMKEMLLDRNASWIAPLEKMTADGGGFVAVGAMHLVGAGSVLALLEKAGFTVARVEYTPPQATAPTAPVAPTPGSPSAPSAGAGDQPAPPPAGSGSAPAPQ